VDWIQLPGDKVPWTDFCEHGFRKNRGFIYLLNTYQLFNYYTVP